MRLWREIVSGNWRQTAETQRLQSSIDDAKMLAARLLVAQLRSRGPPSRLSDAEFKVFSQFGDDGIIQYLVRVLSPLERRFIEFGVQDYSESNTRFLLLNDNWSGLVLDGSAHNMERLRRQEYYWRHDVVAVHAFVDRDNVNELFRQHGFVGELGLLSIDVDGNDYWLWKAVEVVQPAIVVCEYNAVLGARRAVTVPYDPRFDRTRAHHSNLYWGSSIKALCLLADEKGFAFVGANSAGNNAYFVRRDRLGPLTPIGAEEGFVDSRFRESRGERGELSFLAGDARRAALAETMVLDVERGVMVRVGDL